jgi:DNA-binding NarL/FixJ family response regulator
MKNRRPAPATTPVTPVLIVDDHPLLREGLSHTFSRQGWLRVCAEAATAEEALEAVRRTQPALVITDLTFPGKDGIELIKDLSAMYPSLPVIVFSMHDEAIYAERCLRAGAKGYLMKQEGLEMLLAAIRKALDGGTFVSPRMTDRIIGSFAAETGGKSPIAGLTDREFEIFQLIGQGRKPAEIARQLHLSPKTVDVHRAHVCEKLELSGSADLLRYAVRWTEARA